MRIRKYFDSFFVLSKSERNGAMILFVIVLSLVIFRFLIPTLIQKDKKSEIDYDQRIYQLEKIEDSLHNKNSNPQSHISKINFFGVRKEKKVEKEDNLKSDLVSLSPFDPNLASFEELIRLGFSTFAARNLITYREKGGTIHKGEDLKRIYGVDSLLYNKINPFITIPDENEDKKQLIEINEADSAALTSLKGIGPAYASRICKYRNYLGGFISIEQLKEVYQLPEETYQSIISFLTLDEKKVKKININFVDIRELKRHPYCNYDVARKIIDYRTKKGYIQSVEQLLHDSVVESAVFNRLSPYLSVQ